MSLTVSLITWLSFSSVTVITPLTLAMSVCENIYWEPLKVKYALAVDWLLLKSIKIFPVFVESPISLEMYLMDCSGCYYYYY